MWVTAIILGAVGALMFVGACLMALRRRHTAERTVETDGTVTALEDRGSGQFPVVSFTPKGADDAVTFSSRYTDNQHEIGQKLRVYYDPGDPTSATIMSPGDSFGFAVALATGGLAMLALGGLFGFVIAPQTTAIDRVVLEFL